MLTKSDTVAVAVPPAFKDRYVVRIIEAGFGLSKSSGKPMITISTEIVGKPQPSGVTTPTVVYNDKSYQIASIKPSRKYFVLQAGPSLERFFAFQRACGLPDTEVDETNPPTQCFEGLLLEAILTATEQTDKKQLTPEEKAAGKTEGDPITDGDGNPITRTVVDVQQFLCLYKGDVGTVL